MFYYLQPIRANRSGLARTVSATSSTGTHLTRVDLDLKAPVSEEEVAVMVTEAIREDRGR